MPAVSKECGHCATHHPMMEPCPEVLVKNPPDWADTLAEKLLAEMRGKPRVVVLRILADAFRRETSELREKLAKAESDLDVFEPVQEEFDGRYVDANHFGYCKDCGSPYVEGEKIWWLGPGKGAYCEGCRKASEWAKTRDVGRTKS